MTLGIVLPKQAQTGPTRSNIERVTWLGGSFSPSPHLLPAQADGNENRSEECKWNLQRSWREKKPFPRVMSSSIARMAPQLDLQGSGQHYTWTNQEPARQEGHMSNHSHNHQLLSSACCPIMPLWLQNCGSLFSFLCIFLPMVPLDSY